MPVDIAVGDIVPTRLFICDNVFHRDIDGRMAAILVKPEWTGLRPISLELVVGFLIEVDVEIRDGGIKRLTHLRSVTERIVTPESSSLEGDMLSEYLAERIELGMESWVASEDSYNPKIVFQGYASCLELLRRYLAGITTKVTSLRTMEARLIARPRYPDLDDSSSGLAGSSLTWWNHQAKSF